MIQVFLKNNSIICSSSKGKKTGLIIPNNVLKKRLNSIGNYLGDNFVLGITQAYGFKILKRGSIFEFWYKTNGCRVNSLFHMRPGEGESKEI